MNNYPIGFLDSGVGGLTVWRDVVQELPTESTIYLADSANCPYGAKTAEEVFALSQKLIRFLLTKKVKLIVVACNTVTVSCIDRLRSKFPQIPIIGTVPVVKTASEQTTRQKIGILSTDRTAASSYQQELIKKFAANCHVTAIGSNQLVVLIEKGDVKDLRLKLVLQKKLQKFQDQGVDVLVLGCTHFPFIRQQVQEILGSNVKILDSGAAIARQVRRILTANNCLANQTKSTHEFFTTGDTKRFEKVANQLLGREFKDKMQKAISNKR